jgi:hypothetical protein
MNMIHCIYVLNVNYYNIFINKENVDNFCRICSKILNNTKKIYVKCFNQMEGYFPDE